MKRDLHTQGRTLDHQGNIMTSNKGTSINSRLAQLLYASTAALALTACGGGGDAVAASSGGNPALPGGNSGGTSGSSACPHAQLADAWINNRLACLFVGEHLIDIASGATGAKSDRAFVIRQETLDSNWNNALTGASARYFRHFICVRNAPENVAALSLATDLAVSIGTSNSSGSKPPQVSAVSLTVAGGNQPGWQQVICDPALHPVIVDYDTRLIQGVNPGALSALQIYDL